MNPHDAVNLAVKEGVEAAVLDVMMPEMDGFDVLKALRENDATDSLPVLFLSALGEAPDRVRGLREGAEDYLAKPFDSDELRLRLDRLLRTSAAAEGLQANLSRFHLADILQQVVQSRNTGRVELSVGSKVGHLVVREGRLATASFNGLAGAEAVLAMLEADKGRCRFVPIETDEEASGHGIQLRSVLMDAAWLVDELARFRQVVPPEWAVLRLADGHTPEIPEEYSDVGISEVHRWIEQLEATTLGELLETKIGAPQRVTLAVAWLVDRGVVLVDS
jgi:CheY-like chemotaxis protein